MDAFHQSLQNWQMFYATVATAAATLTGLLFVSLSLNRERLHGGKPSAVLATARRTFGDFLYVLMIALVFLVPHAVPYSLSTALIVLSLARLIGMTRELMRFRKIRRKKTTPHLILREIAFPFLASFALIYVGVAAALGNFNAMFMLVVAIAALLVSACWNAWLLLMMEEPG